MSREAGSQRIQIRLCTYINLYMAGDHDALKKWKTSAITIKHDFKG